MALKSSIKDFEVLNKLGQGSFGTVFKVRRKLDKNFYVMKVINISQMDRRGQQESINEVKILASLDSPYIVKYFDSFIENKTLHIIMEFCDKGDLSQAIRSQMGRLIAEPKIWKYFIQMCLGLEFCHSKKILHRDIKSMNVFLIRDDMVRIGDLGVAKVLANTAAFAHTMVGTPYYLSPELCEEKPYNVKSDVWALGCVLYELCTLKHPFDALNQAALLLKIIKGSYIPISTNYSSELRELMDLCLLKDYRKRLNITQILTRPGIREKAITLNIAIPASSILAGTGAHLPKEPAFIYQPQMAIIEEEKVPASKAKQSHDGKVSPGPNKNIAKKEAPVPLKVVIPSKVMEIDPKKPVENIRAKLEQNGRSPMAQNEFKVKEIKIVEKEVKKMPVRSAELREKDLVDNKIPQKPKSGMEVVAHMNNIQFEPPVKLEPRISDVKPKQPVKMTPKNIGQRLESKPEVKNEALKLAANKAVIKASPRPDNKQKIIKPGVQAPHFMPPQRPQDPKLAKKEPEAPKLNEDIKDVQQLPDYPKPKKPSISILKSVLIKFEVKKFEALSPPIFEDIPCIFDQLSDTIDWNFTQTGFTGKDIIPVATFTKHDFQEFQVNYAKSTSLDSENEENDDELYQVSDSDNEEEEEEEAQDHYENEGFDEESETIEGKSVAEKIKKCEKELIEVRKLEQARRKEIVDRVGMQTFEEMYDFFKQKASNEGDLNEDEQREIENFMYTRVSIENTDICIIISKLFHNESERIRLETEIKKLKSLII